MKPQTEDNLRCLAAAVFVFVGKIAATAWFPSWPEWAFIAVFVLLLPVVALYVFNSRRVGDADRVCFDDKVITRNLADGKTETVRWDDLQEVGIVTTDEGPAAEDVYWMLVGTNGGSAVSGGAQGMKELLTRLQQLPGFDNEAVIKAMGSTRNDNFVCWKRSSEGCK